MSRTTRITPYQIRALYWPEWRAAERVLVAAGLSKAEAEETRKGIHQSVTGSPCSSKDLTNRTLDEVLKKFAAISAPQNGTRQADLADGPAKRVRWQINRLRVGLGLSTEYVESIAQTMHRAPLAHLDESQVLDVLKALQYHRRRQNHDSATSQPH